MTALDTRFRELARSMLDKFGKSATYTVTTEGAYDVATGTAAVTETSSTVKVFIDSFSGQDYMSGLVERTDKKLLLAAVDVESPKLGDKVTIGSDVYRVIPPVRETWSGEFIAMFELQVRK